MDPEDADYVCTLTEASLEKAKKELNEDPAERLGAVKALRDWIKQQPHLHTPTTTVGLLQFLRVAKFSQLRARELYDNVYSLINEIPEWFKNVNCDDPDVKRFIKLGVIVPLGIDKNGCLVLLQRPAKQDPDLMKDPKMKDKFMLSQQALWAWFLKDENVQVNGVVFLVDNTGLSSKHQSMTSMKEIKMMSKFWKNAMVMRFKAIHIYNVGPVWEAMMQIFRPFMPKKFHDRMHLHGSNLESVYKVLPMELLPDEYLPDDYTGPRVGSTEDVVDKLTKEMDANTIFKKYLLELTDHSKYFVDESKRPKPEPELQASFRKLNVD